MLDPNVYSDEDPDPFDDDDDVMVPGTGGTPSTPAPPSKGGSTAGKTSRGGQPGRGGSTAAGGYVGIAGTGFVPGGGGTSAGGGASTPSVGSLMACVDYCSGYERTCSQDLNGRDCFALCSNEVDSFGPVCQSLGVKALVCLTPFLRNSTLGCDEATARGLRECGTAVNRFQDCKTNVPPQPTPLPPPPSPGPCEGYSSGDAFGCKMSLTCTNLGTYSVDCQLMNNGLYTCNCYTPNGSISNTNVMAGGPEYACSTAAQYCGVPQ
jgi:hypothetical protein